MVTTDRAELVADCRLRASLDLLAHTWDPVVLAALAHGARRRAHLRRDIGGATGLRDKPLTQALGRLVAAGLVARHEHHEASTRVEYALTPLGRSFLDGPLAALGRWTIDHADQLGPTSPTEH